MPPSNTCTWPSSQIERPPATTEPGMIALKVDDSEQVPPAVVLAVAAHGTVKPNGVACTVPGSSWAGPLKLSVICTCCSTRSSPV